MPPALLSPQRVARIVRLTVWTTNATHAEAELVAEAAARLPLATVAHVSDSILADNLLAIIRRGA